MTGSSLLATEGGAARWTSPFCLLLCDTLDVRADASGTALALGGGECAGARSALPRFSPGPSAAGPLVDGRSTSPDDACAAAARILAGSRQPLFGGLGTDVAGARALYRLASETSAICDAAGGEALMHTVRPLQDRGGYGTTLAEVRNRADLVVCLGGLPTGGAAELLARCGVGAGGAPRRELVVLGGSPADPGALQPEAVALQGDLFDTVALLSALVARRAVPDAAPGLATLADRLLAARYGVIVGQADMLPAQGALIVEGVQRIVSTLNASTRAAAMWLGGGNGAGTVNQVFTWLCGLPLRSRAGTIAPEHDPVCFGAERLLQEQAVDSLLWISCFDPDCAPPSSLQVPLVVLGHPELAASASHAGSVFIPVSTPGIGSPGHLFRADGGAVLPLVTVYRDSLPTLAEVLGDIVQRVRALRAEALP